MENWPRQWNYHSSCRHFDTVENVENFERTEILKTAAHEEISISS
jgi:hypothetical protein